MTKAELEMVARALPYSICCRPSFGNVQLIASKEIFDHIAALKAQLAQRDERIERLEAAVMFAMNEADLVLADGNTRTFIEELSGYLATAAKEGEGE